MSERWVANGRNDSGQVALCPLEATSTRVSGTEGPRCHEESINEALEVVKKGAHLDDELSLSSAGPCL
jgi:hypothetical protein